MTTLAYPSSDVQTPPFVCPAPGLSAPQLAEIEHARARSKKIRRAAIVATTDAWISAIFAGVTALSAIFSPWSIVLAAALGIIVFNSFRGARRLRAFDPTAPRLLAFNQIALALTLIAYAAWSLWTASRGAAALPPELAAEPTISSLTGSLDRLYWLAAVGIYGGMIGGTIVAQGLAALYYATRAKHIAAYLATTPAWILQLQRAQAGD